MEAFTTLDAVAIPIDQPNLDTDQIIPARFLGKPREMQVGALFHDLRYAPDKSPRPDFVTNRPAFAGAKIVVAERNFACGSSRENAVTVMVDNGLRAFIANLAERAETLNWSCPELTDTALIEIQENLPQRLHGRLEDLLP